MSPTAADETWTTVRYHKNFSYFRSWHSIPYWLTSGQWCWIFVFFFWQFSGLLQVIFVIFASANFSSHHTFLAFSLFPQLSFKHSVPHSASNSPRLQNIPEVWWNIHVLPLTSFLFRILFFPLIMGFLTSCRDFCRCLAVTSGSLSPRSRLHAVLLVWALQDTHS